MDCSCFFPIAWKSINDCSWIIILPLLRLCVGSFVLSSSILTPYPNGYMFCFNHLHNLKLLIHISDLVKTVSERSLFGKKSQFLSKSGFCCYLGIYLLQPGYILSSKKLHQRACAWWHHSPTLLFIFRTSSRYLHQSILWEDLQQSQITARDCWSCCESMSEDNILQFCFTVHV